MIKCCVFVNAPQQKPEESAENKTPTADNLSSVELLKLTISKNLYYLFNMLQI